jgi:hypothetical protein
LYDHRTIPKPPPWGELLGALEEHRFDEAGFGFLLWHPGTGLRQFKYVERQASGIDRALTDCIAKEAPSSTIEQETDMSTSPCTLAVGFAERRKARC